MQPTNYSPQFNNKSLKKINPKKNNKKRIVLIIAAIVLIGIAIYILFLLISPKIIQRAANSLPNSQDVSGNRLIINKISLNSQINEGGIEALEKGVWQRKPAQGNPETGGNMILTGHSFVWGYTPQQIKERSIFYDLPTLKQGDEVSVKWNDKTYKYKVSETKTVKPSQIDIENQTKDPQLTIYTCTLSGSADGRIVVIAKPAS